ncbi:unnamed protein product [Leptosia nina]|uniref:CMP-sialic acid transporter n=1 Tax=Leptosia nina TaxID=320188 RepID=A0AAV1ITW4_9NEOP
MNEWKKLFPNKEGFIVFALYIILFVFQGVFITASKTENGIYDYNTTLVVFLSELLKLVISSLLYTLKQGDKPHIFKAIVINYNLLLQYFIPSLLYCFYNNLAFINLSHYDPTSYYILLQFRVVLTAFIFQFLFKKKLAFIQWISLGILTIGCMIKNFDAATITSKGDNVDLWSQIFNIYFLSINFQNFCSCLAGEIGTVFQDFQSLGDVFVILITINSAIVGIVTSFFLKNLNSILKTYASALELIITAVVCYILFKIVITFYTIVSICLVVISVAMYFKNPVNNVNVDTERSRRDKAPLLDVAVE